MNRMMFPLRLFVWFSIRHLMRHPARAATVLLGVALGAAVFTSVRLSVHASLDTFTRSMDRLSGRADRVITRPGGRVPERLAAALLQDPAVLTAAPVMSTYVRPASGSGDPFLLLGLDPILDRPFRQWTAGDASDTGGVQWMELMRTPWAIIPAARLADRHGWRKGDTVTLEFAAGARTFRIAGTLPDEGLASAQGGHLAVVDIATFQEASGHLGRVDRIDLRFHPETRAADLDRIAGGLPEGVVLQPPTAARESGRMMIRAYQVNLSILSFASLFVGMFLVYSLVALNAASRRGELAVLRCLGASPGLLLGLFLAEGMLLGLTGWMTAIPVTAVLVKYLLAGVGQTISTLFVQVQVDRLVLSPWETVLSLGVTVLVSVAAAVQPAREAMGVSPREVMSLPDSGADLKDPSKAMALAGASMVLSALPLSRLPGPPGIPVFGYLATLLLFVGFSLLAPWGLRRLGRAATPLLRKYGGMPAYLAGRYVRDSGIRTTVSVGALITAVALYTALVIMIFSFRETVKLWVAQTVSGDLFVAAKMAEINQFQEPLPARTMRLLQTLDTPVRPVPSRRYSLDHGGAPYQLEGMDMGGFLAHGSFVWLDGRPDEALPRLLDGRGVLVSEVFANRTGLARGRRFSAQVESVTVDLPIVGVIRDYRTRGGVVFCDLSVLERKFPDLRWTGVRFFLAEDTEDPAEVLGRLRREITAKLGDTVDMVDGQTLRASVLRIFDETFAVTTVLLLIALVVAALGITTTLTVLILERRHQLNTLIAVGAGAGQIRAMVLWEALMMVTAGLLAGWGCGFVLSHLLVFVVNRQSFGWTFLYRIDWVTLLWSLPLIAGTAVAGALPAVRTVFRQPPAIILRRR